MRAFFNGGGRVEKILDDLKEISGYIWEKGWGEKNAGNLSVDATDETVGEGAQWSEPERFGDAEYPALAGRVFVVTASGRRFRDIAKDAASGVCVVRLTEDGRGIQTLRGAAEGNAPTSELKSHLKIHDFLRSSGALEKVVLHTHPTELIALTHLAEYRGDKALNDALWGAHPEVKVAAPRGAGFVPYETPGSESLAEATLTAFKNRRQIALWDRHGSVCAAETVIDSFDVTDTINKAAKIILAVRAAGGEPIKLTKEQLDELVKSFGLKE